MYLNRPLAPPDHVTNFFLLYSFIQDHLRILLPQDTEINNVLLISICKIIKLSNKITHS